MSEGESSGRDVWLLVLVALVWSSGGLLIKGVNLPPLAIAGWRSAFACLTLTVIFRRHGFRFGRGTLTGALCYATMAIVFVLGTRYTTAGNAILLQYTAPLHVALLSHWLLGESVTRRDWVAIAVALVGMTLFFFDRLSPEGWLGCVFAILSGVTFAGVIVSMRRQKAGSPITSVILGNALAALVCIPFMWQTPPAADEWSWLILLGAVQFGLGYALFSVAIRRVTALQGVMVPLLEPILNPVWVYLWLGETLGGWAVVGGGLVILAVVMRSTGRIGRRREAAAVSSSSISAEDAPLPLDGTGAGLDSGPCTPRGATHSPEAGPAVQQSGGPTQ